MNKLRLVLIPFSWIYAAVMLVRRFAYSNGWMKSFIAEVPVISVGNITLGGTGKTPMAAFIISYLKSKGVSVGYLSRGYGRLTKGYLLVNPSGQTETFGDEALLIAGRFPDVPVAVCEDRVEGARRLVLEEKVQMIVLDDGFQHLRIRRNLDIVMIDATRLPWSDHVLPAGNLREPLGSLNRSDLLIFTKIPLGSSIEDLQRTAQEKFPTVPSSTMELRFEELVDAKSQVPYPVSFLETRRFVAFSGLGNNDFFLSQLEDAGTDLAAFFPFPDHHPFTKVDWAKILDTALSQTEISGKFAPVAILTTEKDYQRLKSKEWFQANDHIEVYFIRAGLHAHSGWSVLKDQIDRIIKK